MPAGKNYPIPFHRNTVAARDVVDACQWLIDAAEAGRNMPDLSRNPNSKLAVIKRCQEEIVRLRRQTAHDVSVIAYLEQKLEEKETPCSTTITEKSSARDAAPTTTPAPPPPPAETAE